jgi:hypothetical protein
MTKNSLQTILQPRFAMGIAMTILSFSTVLRHVPDFHVAALWSGVEHKAMCVEDRALEYYKDLRLIYLLERRLNCVQNRESSTEQRETCRATQLERRV